MWQLLRTVKKHLSAAIAVSMAAGFLFGLFSGDVTYLKNWIMPVTIIMILPMMVTFPISSLFRQPPTLGLVSGNLLINFLLIPAISLALGRMLFPAEPGFFLGMLMIGLIPTSGMTISWTGFAGGNVKASVSLMVIGLLAGAVLAPLYLMIFMGSRVEINLLSILNQILLVVFIPMIAGALIRRILIARGSEDRFHGYWKPRIPSISTLGVLGIVFLVAALKAEQLFGSPQQLIYLLVPVLLFYGLLYVTVTMIGRRFFSKEDGIALVFSTVMRNLSLSLAIAVTAFPSIGSQAALLLALAYVVQVQSASFYARFAGRTQEKHQAMGVATSALPEAE